MIFKSPFRLLGVYFCSGSLKPSLFLLQPPFFRRSAPPIPRHALATESPPVEAVQCESGQNSDFRAVVWGLDGEMIGKFMGSTTN